MATKKPKKQPSRARAARRLKKTVGVVGTRGRAERLCVAMARVRAGAEQVIKEADEPFLDREAVSRARAFAHDILLGLEMYEETNWP